MLIYTRWIVFFNGLPLLSGQSTSLLDKPVTLLELYDALLCMKSDKVPGIDGLSSNFYKTFWNIVGQDLLLVLLECIGDGMLPLSCKRGVIALLPKSGDNGLLKNWRPISLLCIDLKIFTKCLSLRLNKVLSSIIHIDQTCGVPGRYIYDNIALCRDIISYSESMKTPMAILTIDQEKAFDRIDHRYLFKVLRSFGFPVIFIDYIRLLYNSVDSVIKVNSILCGPIQFLCGIRQGCSLSGQLYALCIEPLLYHIRKCTAFSGLNMPIDGVFKLSAYADDVTLFISKYTDLIALQEIINMYESASNSRVNWNKTCGLALGGLNVQECQQIVAGKWSIDGIKVLGVYLGNETFIKTNWVQLENKVHSI